MNDNAVWSRRFAQQVAQVLGFPTPETSPDGRDAALRAQGSALMEEITEAFRYLPASQLGAVRNLARFLRESEGNGPGPLPCGWAVQKLGELRDYAQFLRARHGYPQPADESDEWTEEDERDFAAASARRAEEAAPYEWEGEEAPRSTAPETDDGRRRGPV